MIVLIVLIPLAYTVITAIACIWAASQLRISWRTLQAHAPASWGLHISSWMGWKAVLFGFLTWVMWTTNVPETVYPQVHLPIVVGFAIVHVKTFLKWTQLPSENEPASSFAPLPRQTGEKDGLP